MRSMNRRHTWRRRALTGIGPPRTWPALPACAEIVRTEGDRIDAMVAVAAVLSVAQQPVPGPPSVPTPPAARMPE